MTPYYFYDPEGLRWRHLDHLGNLRLKTNNLGDAVCSYYYTPYGEISYKSCTEADDY